MENILFIFVPLAVGAIAQITKFIIFCSKHGFNWNYFMTHGHMPSAHSAFAVSLVVTVSYLEGVTSAAFVIALALSLIIIDDAVRLRMYLGDQGRYLNMLIQSLELDPKKYPRLKERVGHRVPEVIVGLIYGMILSIGLIWIIEKIC